MTYERKEFRRLVSIEEALRVLSKRIRPKPLGVEEVPLSRALGRVLAEDVAAPLDLPPFDRAAMDGYAVRAEDVEGADEWSPVTLKVIGSVEAGESADFWVSKGEAVEVATGAAMPPGADAVVMVEHTIRQNGGIRVLRSVPKGANVYFTGSDVSLGETLLFRGTVLGPAEIGVLASLGLAKVKVFKRPKVAIVSIGNELVEPGAELPPYKVYDTNTYSIAAAVSEIGCEPQILDVLPDDINTIREIISQAAANFDVVITSGGTSAGRGDYVYRVLEEIGEVLVHGLKIKPGKPTVLAVVEDKPVIGLPGYPLSAIMAFQLVARPLLEAYSGIKAASPREVTAKLTTRLIPERGRVNLIPVCLRRKRRSLLAHPLRVRSGAIEALLLADAFLVTRENEHYISEGESRKVRLLRPLSEIPDVTGIGSHCMALELALRHLRSLGYKTRYIVQGSTSAFISVREGAADFGGVHLLDPETGEYNTPYLTLFNVKHRAVLVRGYLREQGFIVKPNNPLGIRDFKDIVEKGVRFINRVRGSGTRALVDLMLQRAAAELGISPSEAAKRIPGFNVEAKSHTAVAAAIRAGRADVGVGIRAAAEAYGLSFIPIGWERYDLLVEKDSLNSTYISDLIKYIASDEFKEAVESRLPGYKIPNDIGETVGLAP